MYAKRLKRKCMVRGCKNIDTYTISRTRENGNTIIICVDCLIAGIKAAKAVEKLPKAEYVPSEAPELFFSMPANNENEISIIENTCPDCGRTFESERGLMSHKRFCKGGVNDET